MTINFLREKLSPSGPNNGRSTRLTIMAGTRTEAMALADPVFSKIHQDRATVRHPFPNRDTNCPNRNFQKSGPKDEVKNFVKKFFVGLRLIYPCLEIYLWGRTSCP